jgi:hypothetical protein
VDFRPRSLQESERKGHAFVIERIAELSEVIAERLRSQAMVLAELGVPSAPYRGIYNFRLVDRPIFRARDGDVRKICRLITIYKAVAISGGSGVGKTSLLNAGLIPALIEDGSIVERVRVQPLNNNEFFVERISLTDEEKPPFLPSVFAPDDSEAKISLGATKLERRIREVFCRDNALAKSPIDSSIVLICDQFEESVTLFEEAPKTRERFQEARICQQNVFDTLRTLVTEEDIPVKIIFSIRDDYQARVLRYIEKFYQQIKNQVYPLAQLSESDLTSIIEGPYQVKNQHGNALFQRRFTADTFRTLEEGLCEKSDNGLISLTETQIACRTLWDNPPEEDHFIKIARENGAVAAVQYLYDRFIEVAMQPLSGDEQKRAKLALTKLITSSGTRNIVSQFDLFAALAQEGIPRETAAVTMDVLCKNVRLVYRQTRGKIPFYEIVSESLIPWITRQQAVLEEEKNSEAALAKLKIEQEKQEERRRIKEEAALEAESQLTHYREAAFEAQSELADYRKAAAETQSKLARYSRYFYVVVGIAVSVALIAFVFAGLTVSRAKREQEEAKTKASDSTNQARRMASEIAAQLEENLADARSQLKSAETARRVLDSHLADVANQNGLLTTKINALQGALENSKAKTTTAVDKIQTLETGLGKSKPKLVAKLTEAREAVTTSQSQLETATTDLKGASTILGNLGNLSWVQGKVKIFGTQEPGDSLALILNWQEAKRSGVFRLPSNQSKPPKPADLDPNAYFVAARWDYSVTPRGWLLKTKVRVKNPKTGKQLEATPVDWGPDASTGAVMKISPALAKALQLKNGDDVAYFIPTPPKGTAEASHRSLGTFGKLIRAFSVDARTNFNI